MHHQSSMPGNQISRQVEMAKELYEKNQFAEALLLLNQSEASLDVHHCDLVLLKDIYNYKGYVFDDSGKLEEAEVYFKKSLEVCTKIGNPVFIYNRYDNLAGVHMRQNKNE